MCIVCYTLHAVQQHTHTPDTYRLLCIVCCFARAYHSIIGCLISFANMFAVHTRASARGMLLADDGQKGISIADAQLFQCLRLRLRLRGCEFIRTKIGVDTRDSLIYSGRSYFVWYSCTLDDRKNSDDLPKNKYLFSLSYSESKQTANARLQFCQLPQ